MGRTRLVAQSVDAPAEHLVAGDHLAGNQLEAEELAGIQAGGLRIFGEGKVFAQNPKAL